jgi:hypothetical protein
MLPPCGEKRRLRTIRISGLIHAASTPALLRFAFRVATHTQGWLPAGWLAFTGRASNPLDHVERFQITPSSSYPGILTLSPVRLEGWRFSRRLPDPLPSLSLLPACAGHRSVCVRPSCIAQRPTCTRSESGPAARQCTTFPRGPRSGPGCSVPVRHHLIGPIRPTRRHIAISPHSGLYVMPSLCGSA